MPKTFLEVGNYKDGKKISYLIDENKALNYPDEKYIFSIQRYYSKIEVRNFLMLMSFLYFVIIFLIIVSL